MPELSIAIPIVLFQFLIAAICASICWLYWKKDNLFASLYARFKKDINMPFAFGLTYKHFHRITAIIFGGMAAATSIIGLLFLIIIIYTLVAPR